MWEFDHRALEDCAHSNDAYSVPEKETAEQALRHLQSGAADAAIKVLEQALERHPHPGWEATDIRAYDLQRMMAHFEMAVREAKAPNVQAATRTLRVALAGKRPVNS